MCQSVGLTSWLKTVYRTYLLIGFYVLVLFLSVLVIPTFGRLSKPALWLTFACAHRKTVID